MTRTPTKTNLAEETGAAAGARAQKASDTVKETAKSAARNAKVKASEKVAERQHKAAGRVEASADAARAAAEEFEPGSVQRQATERIAAGLSDAALAIRTTDMRTVIDETTAFARRNPVVFAGGAALLGFAAARMLKASDRQTASFADQRDAFRTDGDRG